MKSAKSNKNKHSTTTKKTIKKCSKIPAEFKNITAIVSTWVNGLIYNMYKIARVCSDVVCIK